MQDKTCPSQLFIVYHVDDAGNVCLPEYISVWHFVLPSYVKDVVEASAVEVIDLTFTSWVLSPGFTAKK